jgi:hypothetical protein
MLHASLRNLIVLVFLIGLVRTESNADIINKDVRRTIDLTTHLVKISNLITVENQGSQPLASYTFVVEPSQADNLAYLSAKVRNAVVFHRLRKKMKDRLHFFIY